MLLSRTADDLFWLARYVERAENTARIIDAALRLSSLPSGYGGSGNEWESAVISTGNHDLFTSLYEEATRETVVEFLAFSPENPSSIRSCLTVARRSARAVRTAITVEMWEAVNGAWLDLHRFDAASMTRQRLNTFLAFVKEFSIRFDGSAYRTMLRTDAYSFSRLGVFLERSDATARILDVKYHVLLPEGDEVGGGLDYFQWSSILRSVSALTAYHWVYRDQIRPWNVAELLILREEQPRSIASCMGNVVLFLDQLAAQYGRQGPSQRAARALAARLSNTNINEIFQSGLHEFLQEMIVEVNGIGASIGRQYLI